MRDESPTIEQFNEELTVLRKRVAELERYGAERDQSKCTFDRVNPQLSAILKAFDGLMYVCSQDYRVEFMNEHLIERTGYDATGEPCYKVLHDRDSICPWCVNERVFGGETVRWETKSPKDNRWYYIVNSPVYNENGTISKMAMISDITDRKLAEEVLLKKSEEKYRELVENANSIILRTDRFGNVTFFNEFAQHFFGYREGEILGKNVVGTIVPPGEHTDLKQSDEGVVLNEGRCVNNINENMRRNGERVWVAWTNKPILDDDGRVVEVLCVGSDTTDRKRAEEELKRTNAYLENVFENSPDPIGIVDGQGKLVLWNKMAAELYGYSFEELRGKSSLDLYADKDELNKMLEHLRQEGSVKKWEMRMKRKDGRVVPVELSIGLLLDGQGKTVGSVCVTRDLSEIKKVLTELKASNENLHREITERRRAEKKSRDMFHFLQTLMDTIPSSIFFKDSKGIYRACNKAYETFLGLNKEDIVGKSLHEVFPKDLADKYLEMDLELFRHPGMQVYEWHMPRADGTRRDVMINKATFFNIDGTLGGLVGVMVDITDRKKLELELQSAHQQLEDIIEFLPDATFVINEEKRVIAWNRAIEEITGVKKGDILGRGDYAYAVPFYGERRPILIDLVTGAEADTAKKYDFFEYKGKTVYGEVFAPKTYEGKGAYLWGTASPLFDKSGNVIGAIQSIRDISDRKHAEKELRLSEERFRAIFESAQEVIFLKDRSLEYTLINPAMEKLLGFPGSRLIGQNADRLFGGRVGEYIRRFDSRVLAGEILQHEFNRFVHGEEKTYHVIKVPIRDQAGQVIGLCGIARDMTERKRAEEELRKYRDHLEDLVRERTTELANTNEQLSHEIEERKRTEEALQETSQKLKLFAYSVAHDLKSPAIGIYGLTRRLQKQYSDVLDEKGKNYCEQIVKVSEHIAALVEKVNVFIATKETPLTIERIDFKDILRMLKDEFSPQLSIRQIKWFEPEAQIELKSDRVSILRIFRNLVDNALKYGGERLSYIKIGHEESGEFHIFSVRDDGKGLNSEDCGKIFGPFQRHETSKGVEGAGLGLTIVKEIVEQHGGKVWIEPGVKKGTTFYFSIARNL